MGQKVPYPLVEHPVIGVAVGLGVDVKAIFISYSKVNIRLLRYNVMSCVPVLPAVLWFPKQYISMW